MTSVIIIDDEEKMTGVLARMLGRDGYDIETANDPEAALARIAERRFDVILCDLRMPGMTGLEVLQRARRVSPQSDFVVMTAYATVQTAVEAMKQGALDYLIKPFPVDELRLLLKRIEETRSLREENQRLREVIGQTFTLENIIASSRPMQDVLARARKVAASNASVLLRGESGTGKEVLAKAIHNLSPRAAGPLVMVNCGAIPETLLESELFGHVKGSFTGAVENRKGLFETAHTGTIFLDEIGEVPLHLQVKLLRVLQEGEILRVGESRPQKVDVRIIAATNRNLEDEVARGRFRQDLYYRLNVIPIVLPPLRERTGDIPLLIEHFLRKFSPPGAPPKTLDPEALALLLRYDYPGNIRELENAIEHAVVLSDGPVVRIADLPLQIQHFDYSRTLGPAAPASPSQAAPAEAMHLDEVEKRLILAALEKTRFNHTRAAQHLGITRRTLGYRIEKYGLRELVEQRTHELKQTKH